MTQRASCPSTAALSSLPRAGPGSHSDSGSSSPRAKASRLQELLQLEETSQGQPSPGTVSVQSPVLGLSVLALGGVAEGNPPTGVFMLQTVPFLDTVMAAVPGLVPGTGRRISPKSTEMCKVIKTRGNARVAEEAAGAVFGRHRRTRSWVLQTE